jgi:predicted lipid-binding transport protein (Tim44 family)
MLRTVFSIGLFTLLGVVALKFALGLFTGVLGGLFGLFFWLLALAVRVALVGLVVYAIIRVVSPETARRLRERFSNP